MAVIEWDRLHAHAGASLSCKQLCESQHPAPSTAHAAGRDRSMQVQWQALTSVQSRLCASTDFNLITLWWQDDGGSPRKATLPGQSLSSGNLGSLGSGGLGPRRGSGHSAGSPRSVRAASGTFGSAGAFSGGGGRTLSSKSASTSSLSGAAFSGSTLQRGAKTLKPPPAAKRGPKPAQAFLMDTLPAPPPQQQLPFEQV